MSDIRKRIVIQGPQVLDLSDLLYFDQVFLSSSAHLVTPKTVKASGINLNDWLKCGFIPEDIGTKLFDANLFTVASIDGKPNITTFDVKDKAIFKAMFNEGHRFQHIITEHDALARMLSKIFAENGMIAVPKYDSNTFLKDFNEGEHGIIGIIFSELPVVDPSNVNINDFIDFVNDEETQVKRRRLFSWQNDIEDKIEKGNLRVEHIPELIATYLDDYKAWLKKSRQKIKYKKREFIINSVLYSLGVISLPLAIKQYFEFKTLKLDLSDDEKSPGRELAYIIQAQDNI